MSSATLFSFLQYFTQPVPEYFGMTQGFFFLCPDPTFVVEIGRHLPCLLLMKQKYLIGMLLVTLKLDGTCQCVVFTHLSACSISPSAL